MLFDDDEALNLVRIKHSDPYLTKNMAIHYSQPKGFVGRNICFSVLYNGECYGHIVGGSATLHLPGRNEYFADRYNINCIINNIFYHIEKVDDRYPIRNFSVAVLCEFRKKITSIWHHEYGDKVIGFESLVELPRTGECYRRDNWLLVGETKGYTCKRVSQKEEGKKTDNWSGKRVWDTDNLRPKLVFVRDI